MLFSNHRFRENYIKVLFLIFFKKKLLDKLISIAKNANYNFSIV